MKGIYGSDTNRRAKELESDRQTLHIRNLELQGRVTALRELYSTSIKNNTGLKAQITWLEDKLLEVRILASKSFSPSSHPSPKAKSRRDHGPDSAPSGQTAPGCPKCR